MVKMCCNCRHLDRQETKEVHKGRGIYEKRHKCTVTRQWTDVAWGSYCDKWEVKDVE